LGHIAQLKILRNLTGQERMDSLENKESVNNLQIGLMTEDARNLYEIACKENAGGKDKYLNKVIEILETFPWNKQQGINFRDNETIRRVIPKLLKGMNDHVLGFDIAKAEICKFLLTNSACKDMTSVLTLRNPHEIGKKTIISDMAKAMGRQVFIVSRSTVDSKDAFNELVYGSENECGCILEAVLKTQTANPIIVLDELCAGNDEAMFALEKFLASFYTDQFCSKFIDKFIGRAASFDLSNVSIILTSSKMKIHIVGTHEVNFPNQTIDEKKAVIKNYLLPKLYKEYDILPSELPIPTEFIDDVING
jgi:ATP-dependent Lon protease